MPTMLASLAVAFVTQIAGVHDSVEIRGQVIAAPRAIINIPALRIGTVAQEGGAFKLRLQPHAGCYELLVTSVTRERTVLRFRPPQTGRLDLGDVNLPKRSRDDFSLDVYPLLADTIGTCQPQGGPWPESWPAGRARVHGMVSRGGRPLRRATIDVSCPYSEAFGRVITDSFGAFATDLTISFPNDQTLVEGGRAVCEIRHATESIDPPLLLIIQFIPPELQPIDQEVAWTLPEPDFHPSTVVAPPGDVTTPAHLGNAVAFRPGVLGAFQFVRIAVVPTPTAPIVYQRQACTWPPKASRAWNWEYCHFSLDQPDTAFREYLLPLAISVSTGHKQATTGSSVYLNLPGKYVEAIEAGGILEAYSRVPLRYTADSAAYIKHGLFYNRSLHLLKVDLIDVDYDDEHSGLHEYEAVLLLAVRPQAVGPSRP